jgi:hypothetical protein
MSDPITIVFPIYPGVTHLDFTGPHQFFARLPDTKVVVALDLTPFVVRRLCKSSGFWT